MSVLERCWRFQSRRRAGAIDVRSAAMERRIFEAAELAEWSLTHPAGVDDVVRAVAHFQPEQTQARVEALCRQAHRAVDAAFDAAICRHLELYGWSR